MEIMSALTSVTAKTFGFICCLFLAHIPGLIAAELVFQKVPPLTVAQSPAYPENIARYHLGANIEAAPQSMSLTGLQLSANSQDTNTAEAALLCDDPTVGYALPSGRNTLLISFPTIENIETISFLNSGAKGALAIATSSAKLPADSPQWHELAQKDLDATVVKANIGPSEAKYVRLTFDVTEPGRIAALGVYSTPTVSSFTMPRSRKLNLQDRSDSFALISYNVSNLRARSRVVYVTSGLDLAEANHMIDGQPASSFAFAAADSAPAAIVDLGKVVSLRRISALYSRRQGTMQFYVLDSLPDMAAGAKTFHLNEQTLANLKPVGSIADNSSGRAAINFPVTAGRYVMMKWTPSAQEDTTFSVAEIATFGTNEEPNLVAANMTKVRRDEETSDGKDSGDAKDFSKGKDFKDTKETPEEGPAEGPGSPLPPPPPFNFVPFITPISPG